METNREERPKQEVTLENAELNDESEQLRKEKQENEMKSRHNEIEEMRMLNHQTGMLLDKKIEG